jgi:hypothetical protein
VVANRLREWLTHVAADAVVVRPDDIDAEARGNLRSFALSPEEASAVSAADVEAFAAGVADARGAWLSARGAGPMVLYWWHDAQAGELRFGLVSAAHGRLPFDCEVVPAESLAAVAADWLGSPFLHGVPLAELRVLAPEESPPEPPPLVLPVWSVALPHPPKSALQQTARA